MDPNQRPYDDYVPSSSKSTKAGKADKDELVNSAAIKGKRLQKRRRAGTQLKVLKDGVAEDVTARTRAVSAGQYKYKGAWHEIIDGTQGEWIRGNEVKGVSIKNLAAFKAAGALISTKEEAKIRAGAASEDPNAPVYTLIPGAVIEEEVTEDEDEAAPPPATATSRRKRPSPPKRKKESEQAEYSPSQRASRKKKERKEDMVEDGSDIEVAHPRKQVATASRRRAQQIEYPSGLEGRSSAREVVEDMGVYGASGGWYAILRSDLAANINGLPVRKVPARFRKEVQDAGGIFDD